jgi:hypothetical protein
VCLPSGKTDVASKGTGLSHREHDELKPSPLPTAARPRAPELPKSDPARTVHFGLLSPDWLCRDPADLHAEVLRGFLDAVARVDVAKPRIMPRLRWAAYRAGYAVIAEELAERVRGVPRPQPPRLLSGHRTSCWPERSLTESSPRPRRT